MTTAGEHNGIAVADTTGTQKKKREKCEVCEQCQILKCEVAAITDRAGEESGLALEVSNKRGRRA